jgi:hypothetical protein
MSRRELTSRRRDLTNERELALRHVQPRPRRSQVKHAIALTKPLKREERKHVIALTKPLRKLTEAVRDVHQRLISLYVSYV